jgi:tetratricopeptide (TPR) repeat protein/transglutaminase-like putative cysteine protease
LKKWLRIAGFVLLLAPLAPAQAAPPSHADWESALSTLRTRLAAPDLPGARIAGIALIEQGLRFADTDPRFGPSLEALDALSAAHRNLGVPDALDEFYEQVVQRADAAGAPASPFALMALTSRGELADSDGRQDDGLELVRSAQRRCDRALAPTHPHCLVQAGKLSGALAHTEHYAEAQSVVAGAVAAAREGLGPDHPVLSMLLAQQAGVAVRSAWPERALAPARENLAFTDRLARPDSRATLIALETLMRAQAGVGDYAEARRTAARLESFAQGATNDLQRRAAAHFFGELSLLLLALGDVPGARISVDRALAIPGTALPDVAILRLTSAEVFEREGRIPDALGAALEAVAINERTERAAARGGMWASLRAARLHGLAGDRAKEKSTFERTLALAKEHVGDDSRFYAEGLELEARGLLDAGRFDEAAQRAERALAIEAERIGADNPALSSARYLLARARSGQGRTREAAELVARARADVARRPLPFFAERDLLALEADVAAAAGDELAARRAKQRMEGHAKSAPSQATQKSDAGLPVFERADRNLRFTPPAGPAWRIWDHAQSGDPEAVYGLVRSVPLMYFLISSAEVHPSASTEGMADHIVRQLEARGQRLVSRAPARTASHDGVRLVIEDRTRTPSLKVVWLTVQGGLSYALTTVADLSAMSEKGLVAASEEVAAGFALLDSTRVAKGAPKPAEKHRSDAWGYTVDLSGTSWLAWPEQEAKFPYADYSAARSPSYFFVIPAALPAVPDLSLEVVAEAFAGMVRGGSVQSPRRLVDPERLEFEFAANDARYLGRVAKSGKLAWLALVRTPPAGAEADVAAALDRVRFDGRPPEPPPVAALDAGVKQGQAVFSERLGHALYAAGRRADAAEAFGHAMRFAEPVPPTMLRNRAQVLLELGRYGDALTDLEAHREVVATEPPLVVLRGVARESVGDLALARKDYETAIAAGADEAALHERYVGVLIQLGEAQAALAHAEVRIAKTPSASLRLARARLLRERGDAAGALAELEALRAAEPGNVDVLYELVESYAVAERHAEALAAADAILAAAPTAIAHYLRGRSQAELGAYAEARASLEQAIALQPSFAAASELLAHVKGRLGEGSTAGVRRELAPVALPPRIAKQMAEEVERPKGADAHGAWLEYFVSGVQWKPGGEMRRTTWWKAHILDTKGRDGLGSVEVPFDPLGEEVFVNALVVRDGEGRELSRGRPEEYYASDEAPGEPVSHRKVLHLPVRALAPGTSLEVVVTRRDVAPPKRFEFVEHYFSRPLPLARSSFFVAGPVDGLVSEASDGVKKKSGDGFLEWTIEEPALVRWEPLSSPASSYLPIVRVADASDSWETVGREYLALIAERLAPSAEVKPIAEAETRGLADADAKAAALAKWVQESLQYRAILFGTRARMPATVPEILDRRYGDCKDHALLLHQLLGAAGVRSELALAKLGGELAPALATLDAFDHVIVRCVDCRGQTFFDATDKAVAMGGDAPRGMAESEVLVLSAERPHLERVGAPDPRRHGARIERTIRAQAGGGLEVRETAQLFGDAAAVLRDVLRALDRARWNEMMVRLLDADIEITALDVRGLEETHAPLEIAIEYAAAGALSDASGRLVGRLPVTFEGMLLRVDRVPDRATPFQLRTPIRIETRVAFTPPAGFTVDGGSERERDEKSEYAQWTGAVAPSASGFDLTFTFSHGTGRFPAREYAPFETEIREALDFLRRPVELAGARAER